MLLFNRDETYVVTATRYDLAYFRETWPASGLGDNPITFAFAKSDDSLVGHNAGRTQPTADSAAVAALVDVCRAFGRSTLRARAKRRKA